MSGSNHSKSNLRLRIIRRLRWVMWINQQQNSNRKLRIMRRCRRSRPKTPWPKSIYCHRRIQKIRPMIFRRRREALISTINLKDDRNRGRGRRMNTSWIQKNTDIWIRIWIRLGRKKTNHSNNKKNSPTSPFPKINFLKARLIVVLLSVILSVKWIKWVQEGRMSWVSRGTGRICIRTSAQR